MAQQAPRVLVGVGVLVHRAGTLLLGKRKGSLGAGSFAVPGGHLEFGESFVECAKRETLEETGIALPDARFCYAVNTIFNSESQYVTIFMKAQVPPGTEPKLLEPHKCEGWQFTEFDRIPEPRFRPLQLLLEEKSLQELLP